MKRRSTARSKRVRAQEPDTGRPTWRTFHALGITASKSLPPYTTWEDVGAAVGMEKQDAYHLCMVALGKLVFTLRKLENNKTK